MSPFMFGEPSGQRNADDMGVPAEQRYDYRDVLDAVAAAIRAERERCAKIAENKGCGVHDQMCGEIIAESIRGGESK